MPESTGGKEPPQPEDHEERLERFYWCDICGKDFDTKRCPQCGLKLKRVG